MARRSAPRNEGPLSGALRVDSSVHALASRLRPGDIALIDIADLDRASAHALVAAQPAAVLNSQTSMSGRIPSTGALVVVDAQIPLIDNLGGALLTLNDGDTVEIEHDTVKHGEQSYTGVVRTHHDLSQVVEDAVANVPTHLRALSTHAFDIGDEELTAVLDGEGLPDLGALITRTAVVVAPGPGFRDDLAAMKRYLKDHRPTIIAARHTADAVAEVAYQPRVIVGSIDGVSESVVKAADHVVLTTDDPSTATRLETLGVEHTTLPLGMRDDDVAIVLAHHAGASSVITVGVHTQVIDLLERDRTHVAGTVITRLQVGHQIIDASALMAVYRQRYPWWSTAILLLASLAAVGAAVWVAPVGEQWLGDLWDSISGLWEG